MPDYQKGKIYKIVDLQEKMTYIGSTIKTLAQRMANHRSSYKSKKYYSSHDIFDTFGIENCKILLIENFPCNSKDELNRREGELIRQFDCVNKQIAGRTMMEYLADNKTVIAQQQLERNKKYRANNKTKIFEYQKHYNAEHKIEIAQYKKVYYQSKKNIPITLEECQQLSQ
jgi:hypothetical protein